MDDLVNRLPWDEIRERRERLKAEGRCDIEAIALAIAMYLPQLGPIALTGAFAGFGTTTAFVAQALAYTAVAAAAFGAQYLLTSRPSVAENAQIITKQALPERTRSYGTVLVGGPLAFQNVASGNLYQEILQGQCQINAVTGHRLADKTVTVDGDGWVTTAPWNDGQIVRIVNALGTADQAAFPLLLSAFPSSYTSNMRWRGVPKTMIYYKGVGRNDIGKYYGAGVPPYRALQQSALLYDPREEEQEADGDPDRPAAAGWTFGDNAALVILDYLRHPDGFRRAIADGARAMVSIDAFYLPEWIAFANLADEAVALKAGGTTPRWRLAGTYGLRSQEPKDVLQGMCQACDAEVYMRSDLKIGIRGGRWIVPTVAIDERHILGHSLKPGARKLSAFNRLNVKYTSADHDYQLTDAEPWRDEANIALRGEELVRSLELPWCPSHSQARRIAKIAMAKGNPEWSGPLRTGPYGLLALNQGTIDLAYAEYGIDRSFVVQGFRPSSNLAVVELTIASLGAADYEFTAASEEGDAPPQADLDAAGSLPTPPDDVTGEAVDGGGGTIVIQVDWTYGNPSFTFEGRYRQSDGVGGWYAYNVLTIIGADTFGTTGALIEGETYQIDVRAISPLSVPSDYSDPIEVVAAL